MTTRTESLETLPKMLLGAVHVQWVRCCRKNCRCAHGQPHGPYWYRLWRENGKLRKRYVRPADVDDVRSRCEARRQHRRQLAASHDEWRRMAAAVRRVEQHE